MDIGRFFSEFYFAGSHDAIIHAVHKLSSDGENREVILSIISLASSMNFSVIAEGVEQEHQLRNIQDMECGYGQ